MERQRDLSCPAALTALRCVSLCVCVCVCLSYVFVQVGSSDKKKKSHYRNTACVVDVLIFMRASVTAFENICVPLRMKKQKHV